MAQDGGVGPEPLCPRGRREGVAGHGALGPWMPTWRMAASLQVPALHTRHRYTNEPSPGRRQPAS